jgi:transposase InsO family protein
MMKQRHIYPVDLMANVLKVSRSGYYSWMSRKPSNRSVEDTRLKPLIRQAFEKGRKTSGSIKIQHELKAMGEYVGRDRISRLRKEMGLYCIQKRKFKATTNSRHNYAVAENLLDQDFTVSEPGMVIGSDITYITTDEGWLYLAGLKDFCTKEIVGYSMGERMTKELTIEALQKAVKYRKPLPGAIHHSDRGVQYCSKEYVKLVEKSGFKVSMSRKGNCYDNAPTESFWGALKQEMVYHHRFRTRLEAKAAITEWIEVYYNRVRRHAALDYLPPSIWAEQKLIQTKEAA